MSREWEVWEGNNMDEMFESTDYLHAYADQTNEFPGTLDVSFTGGLQEEVRVTKAKTTAKSCLQCYKSRQRCDGQRPCGRCVTRGDAANCCDRNEAHVRKKRQRQGEVRAGDNHGTITVVVVEAWKGCNMGHPPIQTVLTNYSDPPARAKSDVATFCMWMMVQPEDNSLRKRIHVNQAFTSLFGYTEEELIASMEEKKGCIFYVVFAKEHHSEIEGLQKQILAGSPFVSVIVAMVTKFGMKFQCLLQANSGKDKSNANMNPAIEMAAYFSPIPVDSDKTQNNSSSSSSVS